MRIFAKWIWALLAIVSVDGPYAEEPASDKASLRVVSWNVSNDGHVSDPAAFRALLRLTSADILLLDEVAPAASSARLREVIEHPETGTAWHIDYGISGGRQRGVIASRLPLEPLPELRNEVPYPDQDRHRLLDAMPEKDLNNPGYTMENGIPVHAAVVLIGEKRLLAVVADLQCCGDPPDSWQEARRRVETREIRHLIRRIVERTTVDAIIVAGDFNLVSTAIPLAILQGPYPLPNAGLLPAEIYHIDGRASWTWDGRGTPFPSRALDFQLYSPQALFLRGGFIFDTEGLSSENLKSFGLDSATSGKVSDHRPLVVEYTWH